MHFDIVMKDSRAIKLGFAKVYKILAIKINMVFSLKEFHITLTNEQFHQFQNYYELMIEWNSFMNLTAITEMDEVIMKHFVDSVSLIQAVPDLAKKGYSLIDIGTGAGFPGIPLKIVFPDLKITLIDSLNKRINYVKSNRSRRR